MICGMGNFVLSYEENVLNWGCRVKLSLLKPSGSVNKF